MQAADLAVVIAVLIAVLGLFWVIGGLMAKHRGHVWLGIIAFCIGFWTILITAAVSVALSLR